MMGGETQRTSRSSNLLVVDGDRDRREAVAALAAGAGFHVRQATDAREAEEQLGTGTIGLVIIDSDLPGVNGFDLCRRIRDTHQTSVYLLLRTTKEQLFSQEFSMDEGADDYLIEPVSDKELLARIETGRKMKQLQEKLEETTRSLALLEVTDPLTGAFNRRRTEDEIQREMDRSRRYGRPVSLVLLDVDGFRSLNEQLGRAAGQRVIKEIARIVRRSTRTTDTLGRFDEAVFAVLLPETDRESALGAAEKMRSVISQTAVAVGEKTIHVTVSAGVATFQDNNYESMGDLVAAAEDAVAQAKAAGRNRCVAV